MGLISILLIALIVVALYLGVRWLLGKLNVAIDNDILVIGAVILFILALAGKVNLGI